MHTSKQVSTTIMMVIMTKHLLGLIENLFFRGAQMFIAGFQTLIIVTSYFLSYLMIFCRWLSLIFLLLNETNKPTWDNSKVVRHGKRITIKIDHLPNKLLVIKLNDSDLIFRFRLPLPRVGPIQWKRFAVVDHCFAFELESLLVCTYSGHDHCCNNLNDEHEKEK